MKLILSKVRIFSNEQNKNKRQDSELTEVCSLLRSRTRAMKEVNFKGPDEFLRLFHCATFIALLSEWSS